MAYYTDTRPLPESGLARAALQAAQWLARFSKGLERQRIARDTYNELAALSDRDLADLGLNRSQLRQVALDAARTKF